jgi:hypothetical protein
MQLACGDLDTRFPTHFAKHAKWMGHSAVEVVAIPGPQNRDLGHPRVWVDSASRGPGHPRTVNEDSAALRGLRSSGAKLLLRHNPVLPLERLNLLVRDRGFLTGFAVVGSHWSGQPFEKVEQVRVIIDLLLIVLFIAPVGHDGTSF